MPNRLFQYIVLALLLMILPLGSYMYLKKGIDYRKTIMKDLSQHKPINDTITYDHGQLLTYANRCTVVSLSGSKNDVKSIYNQFKEAKGFQLLANINPDLMRTVLTKSTEENNIILAQSYRQIDSLPLDRLQRNHPDKQYMIIDSLSNIRYTYSNSIEDKQKLVAHITALLPYFDEKKGK